MLQKANISDPLLQPFQLKHLTLRNRIMSTAHSPHFTSANGYPNERYMRYYEEKAKGGLALAVFGGSSNVSADSPPLWGQIDLSKDAVLPSLTEISTRMHAQGAAVMCQVTHMGRRTVDNDGHFLPVIGPSHVRERLHRAFPKAMEQADIDRVVRDFAMAAARCQEAGLDGIELLSFGHLIGQFLSPAINHRTDGYGGSVENRMRFAVEVLEAVRVEVGPDFIVGIRSAADEQIEGGNSEAECIDILRRLAATGMLDFLNVNVALPVNEPTHALWMPSMGQEVGSHLDVVGRVRKSIGLPVFYAGGITDLATARHALREGLLDMAGMTRAHMADPHIVEKIERGNEDFIRPCVGAGYCVNRGASGLDIACIHNVVTGREESLSHKFDRAENARKIVIVGGGPGGLEAARVCAERGHDVVLMEASDRLGGQLSLAARPKSRRQMQSITDWLKVEIERLGVDIRYNVFADASAVLEETPDAVIVATGGLPNTHDFESKGALTVWDVLSGAVTPSGSVLLYDDHGNHQGLSCAEYLIDSGVTLEIATPDRAVGQELRPTNRPLYMRYLYEHSVELTSDVELIAIERDREQFKATLRNEYTGKCTERFVDHVVVEAGVVPFEDVFFELKEGSSNKGRVDIKLLIDNSPQPMPDTDERNYTLYRVGDAVSGRDVHSAMYDAHRLCRHL